MDTHPIKLSGLSHVRSGAVVLYSPLLAGVSHVKVSYPRPPSCSATTGPSHITVHLDRRVVVLNPVFSRWTVLRDVTAGASWVFK